MRRIVPAGLALLALLATLYVLFRPDEPVELLPSGERSSELGFFALEGLVLDRAGEPYPGVSVRARILDKGPAYAVDAGTTDDAGRFAARLFPPRGAWEIEARPSGGIAFRGAAPVLAEPGGEGEIVLRQPPTDPATPPEPNLAGEVADSFGRTLTGVPILIYGADGEVIERLVSGERGVFATYLEVPLPIKVGIEDDKYRDLVRQLPILDMALFKRTLNPGKAELEIRADLLTHADEQVVDVELWNSVGQRKVTCDWWLGRGPWTFVNIPFGAYDVRLRGKTVAGVVQGFEFSPDNRVVRIPVGECSRVKGTLSRSAEVVLFSRSPTWVPLGARTRETFGSRRRLRGNFAGTKGRVKEFDFPGIAAGRYLLRCSAWGVETKKIELEVKAGEPIDLGLVELEPATGMVTIEIAERKSPAEFAYRVILYTHDGLTTTRTVSPDRTDTIFTDLPAGTWHYRVSRKFEAGHHRTRGMDHRFELKAGEEKRFVEDCSWRL